MSEKNISLNETKMISRRNFFEKLILILGGLMTAAVGVPLIGFVFKPLFKAVPPVWRPVGKVNSFKIGETVPVSFIQASPLPWAGVTAKTAAWLRRESADSFTAFSTSCTHLGCPVRWQAGAQLFMCPCHGGVYYKDGSVAAGPPPAPLPRYSTRIVEDQVEILVML
ncbi:MAG TPA: Rieske 2Fe-2S domain-containing protein [bacterium]|nr:Rieske 2Fe-2S domain-containing protein [bacterium]